MNSIDYYSALEVNEDVTGDEIKTAFRRLALKYHPDKNPGDEEAERKFKEIAAAYDILADPSKRREYDLTRRVRFTHSADSFNCSGPGAAVFGRGMGCCGMKGMFRRCRKFSYACVVDISPEEARVGTEKQFIMDGPQGYTRFSVPIPAGAESGAVLRVSLPGNDFPSNTIDIHIRIK